MPRKLRLILGDQLNSAHSWFQEDGDIVYLLMEMRQETDYTQHHIQKIVGFFSAMRNFAKALKDKGAAVIYYKLDDKNNQQELGKNIAAIIKEYKIDQFEYQLPDEYRLDQQLKKICQDLKIRSEVFDTEHFLTKRADVANFFAGKKTFVMESFYRQMRKAYNLLLLDGEPEGGNWNYDAENRKKIPKNHVPTAPKLFEKSVEDIVDLIQQSDIKTIGNIDPKHFIWPTSRKESLALLSFFCKECLPRFGDFQDAMTPEYWSLYHSRLSFSLNTKMLHPLEVVQAAIKYWEQHKSKISLSQIEGFVRQIIGWREYMRGIYWAKMPEFAQLNFLNHKRKLPSWFWTGKTKMACLQHAIKQSLDFAYAHHIQRLMITGNFALLAGIDPDEVDQWYLGIYIDAIEWVEITNTRGMSQFADGGIVGTKPYVSSANYIDKMSHYCRNCFYNKKEKTGPKSCPFNSLYWHFYDRHEKELSRNPRIGMAYRLWNKMDGEKRAAILERGNEVLEGIEEL